MARHMITAWARRGGAVVAWATSNRSAPRVPEARLVRQVPFFFRWSDQSSGRCFGSKVLASIRALAEFRDHRHHRVDDAPNHHAAVAHACISAHHDHGHDGDHADGEPSRLVGRADGHDRAVSPNQRVDVVIRGQRSRRYWSRLREGESEQQVVP